MATLSHRGLRTLIDDWGGCDYFFSEMIDCKSFIAKKRYESYYADPNPDPARMILQFVGAQEDHFLEALTMASSLPVKGFDLNMGCSAPQITKYGGGISWMTQPEQAWRLVEKARKVVKNKSLSIKFRLGDQEDSESLRRFCLGLESAGADFLTLHPRIRRDTLSRPSRWIFIKDLKPHLKIPLWGNGDMRTLDQYTQGRETGADGLMIGREAVRSPWIFFWWKEKSGNPRFTLEIDRLQVAQRFHELLETYQPRDFWLTRAQRFWTYFLEPLKFGAKPGAQIRQMREYSQVKATGENYLETHPEDRHLLLR